jgi:hypothetical protein
MLMSSTLSISKFELNSASHPFLVGSSTRYSRFLIGSEPRGKRRASEQVPKRKRRGVKVILRFDRLLTALTTSLNLTVIALEGHP